MELQPAGESGRGRRTFPVSEDNKALVCRFVEEFWNEGNTTIVDELMAIDTAIHMPTGEAVNPEGFKRFAAMWRDSFPDWHSTVEELIAEGDRVAERWTGRGIEGVKEAAAGRLI